MRSSRLTSRSAMLGLAALTVSAIALGCDDDPTGGVLPTSDAGGGRSDAGAPGGTDAGPVVAPDAGGGGGTDAGVSGGSDAGVPRVYAAVIRGWLAGSDLASAQAAHDMIASGGEAASRAAGDTAHDVLLGAPMLDTPAPSPLPEFLAIDRWTDATAMRGFYSDPRIAAAFGSLFREMPTIEFFELAPDWVNWGTMESGDASDPYYFHFALGTLSSTDLTTNRMAHNGVASHGMAPSIGAGNVAHVVFLGLDDPRRFLAVDIWGSDDNITAFYTNPDFVAAFAPLFESVSQPVYESTDWYQW